MLHYAKEGIENNEYHQEEVPLYKKVLCGNNPLGDWHYRFWKDTTCQCCGFYRGMLTGFIYSVLIAGILKLVF